MIHAPDFSFGSSDFAPPQIRFKFSDVKLSALAYELLDSKLYTLDMKS